MEFGKEEKKLMIRIGEELKKLRIAAGYKSSETFALEIEMDSGQYGRYEKGRNIKVISLYRLLSHHDIRIDEFFERVFSEHRNKDSKIIQMKNNKQ